MATHFRLAPQLCFILLLVGFFGPAEAFNSNAAVWLQEFGSSSANHDDRLGNRWTTRKQHCSIAKQSPGSSTQLSALSELFTEESIHSAFSVATFGPQPFWVLLTLLPNAKFTKNIMGGMETVTLCALLHFFIVVASIMQPGGSAPLVEFNEVFDPRGDPQKAFIGMMQYPNFITEEWSHVLTWDLFVGRWIWLDGLTRGIFTSHSVLLCNLIGPPGLLLHWATCIVTGKGLVPNQVPVDDDDIVE